MKSIFNKNLPKPLSPDDIAAMTGENISLSACVHKINKSGKLLFITLRTGRYIFQSVCKQKECEGDFDALCEGAYIRADGAVKEECRALHGFEIHLTSFQILSVPSEKYPINISAPNHGCSVEAITEHRAVSLRHSELRAIIKIREGIVFACRDYFQREGFTEIDVPQITKNGVAARNLFKLKYFGQNAVLSDNAQLHRSAAVASFDRVFDISRIYRADKHNSSRHLNEFTMLGFDIAYTEDLRDIMAFEGSLLKHIFKYLASRYQNEIQLLNIELPKVNKIPSLTFSEAFDYLGKDKCQYNLDPTDERKLSAMAKEKLNSDFIFVELFPDKKIPFFVKQSTSNPRFTESFSLLFKGMEISTGNLKVSDYGELLSRQADAKYTDTFKALCEIYRYGMPPYGGAEIGLERFVMMLTNAADIRFTTLFTRDLHHLIP